MREVELGSHRQVHSSSFASGSNSCFSDTTFVALLRTAVETAVSEVHKLLRTVVLAVANGLFGLYGSESTDELFMSSSSPQRVCVCVCVCV